MQFIQGQLRQQTCFATLEDQVAADNPVRLREGRPPYSPQVLLKLDLYGCLNKVRSSRKLERECSRNVELQWLLQNLVPNYHTNADFRKMHAQPLQSMFRLYVQYN